MFPVEAAERSKEMLSHGGHPEQFPVDIRGAVSPISWFQRKECSCFRWRRTDSAFTAISPPRINGSQRNHVSTFVPSSCREARGTEAKGCSHEGLEHSRQRVLNSYANSCACTNLGHICTSIWLHPYTAGTQPW